jgi:hypothetical protein
MLKRIFPIFLLIFGFVISNACTSQNDRHTAATFAVRVFSRLISWAISSRVGEDQTVAVVWLGELPI